jgi:hypothetical protein
MQRTRCDGKLKSVTHLTNENDHARAMHLVAVMTIILSSQ